MVRFPKAVGGRRLCLSALLLLPALLAAQPRRDDTVLYEPVPPFRCEAVAAPSGDPALSRLDVHLWLQPSLLVFVRTPADTSSAPFTGTAELSVEVYDTTRAVSFRRYVRRRVSASSPDAASLPTEPIAVSVSMAVPPGTYTVLAEASDAESQRRLTRRQSVTVGAFPADGGVSASSILWCRPGAPGEDRPFFGHVLPLGERASGLVAFSGLPQRDSVLAVLRLERNEPGSAVRTPVAFDSVRIPVRAGVIPAPDTLSGGRYAPFGASSTHAGTIEVPVRADTLPPGSYRAELSIGEGALRTVAEQNFTVQWERLPRSLAFLGSALRPLQHLMAKEEYAALKELDPDSQRAAFERFWRGRNPSPGSAANDVMREFYRRVDLAAQEFATIRHPDGAMTDRGKVFILLGPPSARERFLGTASAPREVWTYAAARTSVIFIDEKRTGDYTLVTEQ